MAKITALTHTAVHLDVTVTRERPEDTKPDDIRGEPGGHFLVLHGIDRDARTVGELWRHLVNFERAPEPETLAFCSDALDTLLDEGPLARRIVRRLDGDECRLRDVYRELCDCLADNRMFHA